MKIRKIIVMIKTNTHNRCITYNLMFMASLLQIFNIYSMFFVILNLFYLMKYLSRVSLNSLFEKNVVAKFSYKTYTVSILILSKSTTVQIPYSVSCKSLLSVPYYLKELRSFPYQCTYILETSKGYQHHGPVRNPYSRP